MAAIALEAHLTGTGLPATLPILANELVIYTFPLLFSEQIIIFIDKTSINSLIHLSAHSFP